MPIDPVRLESQLRADADVLQNLAKNGDVAKIVRPIDVRFVVEPRAAEILKREIERIGWFVLTTIVSEEGLLAIDAQVDQTTDADAISELTKAALEIEDRTGAQYDGWGTPIKRSN